MNRIDSSAALNRLLATLYRSLSMYLADAVPWVHPGDEQAKQVLSHLVADYRMYSGRIVELLTERRYLLGFGEFPMAFTDTHDLSLDYLVNELVFYQKQDIQAIVRCVAELGGDPAGRNLAEEILGNAKGHLESLEELRKQPV